MESTTDMLFLYLQEFNRTYADQNDLAIEQDINLLGA
jgi:hypothetical protein